MKKAYMITAATAGAMMLAACGETASENATAETAEATTETVSEDCTQETLLAKATEVGEKMQGLASDPEAMAAMAEKMQEVQASAQEEGYDIAAACAVYDELLAEG
ncbi:MAG: hypothetical protein ABJ242_12450 [Marinomonas sp.]